MNKTALTLALALLATPAMAEKPNRDALLVFISQNRMDENLYNLLAATIPSTEAGQSLYEVCGPKNIEDLFENAYSHVRKTMGEAWRGALADVYETHLSASELTRLSGLDDTIRPTEISQTFTSEPIINDLRVRLSPLVEDATALHVNHMIDNVETLCKLDE